MEKGQLLTRAGKKTGKYCNSWNVIDPDGNKATIDFGRDVEDWKVDTRRESNGVVSQEESPTEVHYVQIYNLEEKEEVLRAKLKEIDSWKKNNVYTEVDDEGQKCISVRWVITPKVINGVMSVKARLVARGFEEIPDFRTDSSTCMRENVRIVLGIIASEKWQLRSIDYKTAFLQGKEIDREVYLKPPSEFKNRNKIWKLRKTVYGLVDAPRVWFLRLIRDELLKLGAKMSSYDSGIFYYCVNGRLEGILACFVDDQLWGGSSVFEKHVIEKLRFVFEISQESVTAFKYVGIELKQINDY